MDKMRVVILNHSLFLDGSAKSAIDLALMLKEYYDVILCVPKECQVSNKLFEDYGINYHQMRTSIPSFNVYSGASNIMSISFLKGIIRCFHIGDVVQEIIELKPNVIIFNSVVTSLIATKISSKKIKKICFVRETFTNSPLTTIHKYVLDNYMDGVAFIADHEKNVIDLIKPKQVIIPDTLEPSSYKLQSQKEAKKVFNLKDNTFYVLYMGGSAMIKGFDTMLDTILYLDENYCVLIAGNVKLDMFSVKNILFHVYNVSFFCYLVKTRKLLKRLKNDPRIMFLGYQVDISPLMCASDVIAFPSKFPHQSRPCIEAGMFGKPVVISDFEATKEFFINKFNALTFIPGCGKDLAEKIKLLRENESLRKLLGRNNRVMSGEKHDYYLIQKEIIAFIQEVTFEEKY